MAMPKPMPKVGNKPKKKPLVEKVEMNGFKPMKACQEGPHRMPDFLEKLKYPLYVSPKIDGIRCATWGGECRSNSNKRLPNKYVQEAFAHLQGFDGEIVVGDPKDPKVYNKTQSIVMSHDKKPEEELSFFIFDLVDPAFKSLPFHERLTEIRARAYLFDDVNVYVPEQVLVEDHETLVELEVKNVAMGYEGVMMKHPESSYKYGRSTFKEGTFYKLKRFLDDEAVVVDFVEQMTNENEAYQNEMGYSSRSTNMENLVPAGTLGSLTIEYKGMKLPLSCGTLTHAERLYIWNNKEEFLNRTCMFRYFGHGVKDKPRHPRFIGWRDQGE